MHTGIWDYFRNMPADHLLRVDANKLAIRPVHHLENAILVNNANAFHDTLNCGLQRALQFLDIFQFSGDLFHLGYILKHSNRPHYHLALDNRRAVGNNLAITQVLFLVKLRHSGG